MARIQFIDNNLGYLELKEEFSIPLNFSIGDIRDISKRKSSFSKTIKAPGTDNNNNLLNHYYDVNVAAGTFDINKIQKCNIIGDTGEILFENGVIQLLRINMIQNTFTERDEIEYELLVKDTSGDFFTQMGNKKLEDLSFGDWNHRYDLTNVTDSWSHDWTAGYKYLLPYNDILGQPSDTQYKLTELKPAIYARQYWDRIFAQNGYSYTFGEIDDDSIQLSKLVIPYNGEVPKMSSDAIEVLRVEATASNIIVPTIHTVFPSFEAGFFGYGYQPQIIVDTEIIDNYGQYNPVTGEYTPNYDAQTPGGIVFTYDIDFDLILENTGVGNAILTNVYGTDNQFSVVSSILNTTTIPNQIFNCDIFTWNLADGYSIPSGTTVLNYSGTVNNLATNINAFNVLETLISMRVNPEDPYKSYWRDSLGNLFLSDINYKIVINDIKLTIKPSSNNDATYGSIVNLQKYVPKNIKQSDFIKSICNMFNLYIIPDENDPFNLIIKTRDKYYDEGSVIKWTSKLGKNSNQQLDFLPDITAKRITLTYKQDSDAALTGYLANTGEIYGQYRYTFDSEYIKNEETKELIFSPTPNMETSFGANLPYILGVAPKNNIRILYDGGMLDCNSYDIYDVWTIFSSFTQYPFMGHFDKPFQPTYDLSYGTPDYLFYENFGTTTFNTLFNKFWRRTYNQINEGRMLTAYFDLDDKDIALLKMNSKIYLKQYESYWNINSVVDYDASKKQLTKVELISIDDELKIPVKRKRPGKPVWTTMVAIKEDAKKRFDYLNTNLGGEKANIIGFDNYIGTNASVEKIIGNNNFINGTNAYVIGSNNTIDVNNVIFTGDNNTIVIPPTPGAASLADTLLVGNTTGPTDIIVDNDIRIKTTDTGYIQFGDTGSDLNAIVVNNGGDGVTTPQNSFGFSGVDPYWSSQVVDVAGITDTISLDPQGLGNGTGIKSQDTISGDYSQNTHTSTSITTNVNSTTFNYDTSILHQMDNFSLTSFNLTTSQFTNLIVKPDLAYLLAQSSTTLSRLYVEPTYVQVTANSLSTYHYNAELMTPVSVTNWVQVITPQNGTTHVKVRVTGYDTGGSNLGYASNLFGVFKNNVTTTTQIGTIDLVEKTDFTTASTDIFIIGTDIYVKLIGDSSNDINWKVYVEYSN